MVRLYFHRSIWEKINRDSLGGTDHTGGTAPSDAVEMVSDENGEFVIYGLDDHVYYLLETDSPAGYREILDLTVFAGETDAGNSTEIEADSPQEDSLLTSSEVEKLGNITIKLEDTSKELPKGAVSLAVVKVADVVNGEYVLTEEFERTNIDLNQIRTANELAEAAKQLQAVNTKRETIITTDDAGEASLSELPVGVYLIYAVDTAQYDNITSALVSIPTFDEEAGVMEYDIEMIPKHEPVPEQVPPVKTGVDDHLMGYVGVLALSFVVVTFLSMKTARNNKRAD